MTFWRSRREAAPGPSGRFAARRMARPGIAVAASAPVSLIVWTSIPPHRPTELMPCLLGLVAAGILVLAAEVASFDRGDAQTYGDTAGAGPNRWSDPAMVSVQRWMAHWPGVAGVSAVSWWAARVGAAGLLSTLAVGAAVGSGTPAPVWLPAAVVGAMAFFSLAPGSRHLVHLALGLAAVAGLAVSASGAVAFCRGSLKAPLIATGSLWPTSTSSVGKVVVATATTVVLLCLGAVCLPSVSPATSTDRQVRGKWATRTAVGVALACWAFIVPALLLAGGLSAPLIVFEGRGRALRSALAATLAPMAGGRSPTLAGWLLCGSCLAGAFGALAGGTGLAQTALGAARSSRAGRHGAAGGMTGAGQPAARTASPGTQVGVAIAGGAGAAGVAVLGIQDWLVIALGGLAAGALALASLAPPVVRQCQRLPAVVRTSVMVTWVLVVTASLSSAGPRALAVDGLAALGGALALGRRGRPAAGSRKGGHLALPWGTATVALVVTSAVTTLEVLPLGTGSHSATVWRGLAVVVMGAGVVVLAVFPATSRLRVEHLSHAASALADTALPALAKTLEALSSGETGRLPIAELSELKAATCPLETELGAYTESNEMLGLTRALVEASRQVQRLAAGVEAVARLDNRRLEELVKERTAMLSHANRNLADTQWRRRQLFDRTVRVAEGERARTRPTSTTARSSGWLPWASSSTGAGCASTGTTRQVPGTLSSGPARS